MKLTSIIDFLIERKAIVLRLCFVALALLVVIDALPMVVDKEHAHGEVEKLPGFWATFGLLGCLLLILLSKGFGHLGIMQREDYYHE